MIEARNLEKRYGDFSALDGVSFDCATAECFGVIGHNGAGKTTLLKCLAGLIQPTSGSLVIDGIDVLADPVALKARLGYLSEESRLYETMTVPDYLGFFGELYGLARETVLERQARLLDALGLDHGNKRCGELSKGMKRKVAIARSLIHDPSLLVYDEPTSGLDPMTSRYIADYLAELRARGKTIILSAHNLFQVEALCDHVLILSKGRCAAFGTMDELRNRFGPPKYRVLFSLPAGRAPGVELAAVADGSGYRVEAGSIEEMNEITAAVAEEGGRVERVESHSPTLEEMLVSLGVREALRAGP
ncbi:MAG TPA: ABC transporter ATP-binding protein [Methanoregulaceae archaeon]|nr:ABC transporter ATP-binding protein [Methanoregulaceae archaeon]HQJ88233.1 ABC transporter ATP-binding protein [Methanoregulaceae archaeon]